MRKVTLCFVPINKFGCLLEDEKASLPDSEFFTNVKDAKNWIKLNKIKLLKILCEAYKSKMIFYSSFEIQIYANGKIKNKYKLVWNCKSKNN